MRARGGGVIRVGVLSEGGPAVGPRIVRRLGLLGREISEMAAAVAVLGASAELHVAARLAGLAPRASAAAADQLVRVGLLAAGRPLAFVHPLVRQAIYDDLGPADRGRRHREAAEVLAELGSPPSVIAAHLLAVEPAHDQWVVDRLVAAAEDASAMGAPGMAVPLYLRALDEPAGDRIRHEIILPAGRAAQLALHPAAPDLLYEALASISDPDQRQQVAMLLQFSLHGASRPAEAVAVFASLYAETGDPIRKLRAAAAATHSGSNDAAAAAAATPFLAELISTVGLDDDPALPPAVIVMRAYAGLHAGEPAAAIGAAVHRAYLRHKQLSPGEMPGGFGQLGLSLVISEHPAAREVLTEMVDLATRIGFQLGLSLSRGTRAWWLLQHGELAAAEIDATLGLDILLLLGSRFNVPAFVSVLIELRIAHGDVSGDQAVLDHHGLDTNDEATFGVTFLTHGRGRLRLAQGRAGDAVADFRRVGVLTGERRIVSPLGPWRADLAIALHHAGSVAEAVDMARTALGEVLKGGAPRAIGMARRAVGVTTADPLVLAQAIDELEQVGDLLTAAQAMFELGSLLGMLDGARRRADHEGDAQVLVGDDVVTLDQGPGKFVGVVGPLAGDLAPHRRHTLRLGGSTRRPLDLAGQGLLLGRQLVPSNARRRQRLRSGNLAGDSGEPPSALADTANVLGVPRIPRRDVR